MDGYDKMRADLTDMIEWLLVDKRPVDSVEVAQKLLNIRDSSYVQQMYDE